MGYSQPHSAAAILNDFVTASSATASNVCLYLSCVLGTVRHQKPSQCKAGYLKQTALTRRLLLR